MARVAILDYGVGNILSVERAFHQLNIPCQRVSEPTEVLKASHLILPGVGAFGAAITVLREKGINEIVQDFATTGKPLLGICLGMQLLFDRSHEFGIHDGLGLVPGEVNPIGPALAGKGKVPSIGWKKLKQHQNINSPLSIDPKSYYYFVHSFMAVPGDRRHLLASYEYAGLCIPAFIRNQNVFGVQFHPEKSGRDGLKLIREFSAL